MTATKYFPTEYWGWGVSCDTLEELEALYREVCERNPGDFVMPEDGLKENRDYTVEEVEVED